MQIVRWLLLGLMSLTTALAGANETIRLGVLKYGTVNWEMDVIQQRGFDRAQGIDLELVQFASTQAAKVALHAGAVDMIVADWVWVARQRTMGRTFSFIPYSASVASLVVPQGSSIQTVADLAGARLGIAGGPMDKTWVLLQALAARSGGLDLDRTVDKVFGAPPLINKQISRQRLDAVINFWHFVARLEAEGMQRLLSAHQIVQGLGVKAMPPMLGFIFEESWAQGQPQRVRALQAASRMAKAHLCTEGAAAEAEWLRLRPLTRAKSDGVFQRLRGGYCEGVPKQWGDTERQQAAQIFALLAEYGGAELVGEAKVLPAGTFWPGADF